MPEVILKAGREKSLLRGHPWVFSGALAHCPGGIAAGETVDVVSHGGDFAARGALSPHSQITVRIWTFDPAEAVDEAFFESRLRQSMERRKPFHEQGPAAAYRLVNGESDGLPGLIVDRYGGYLVIQCLSAGVELWKRVIVDVLDRLIANQGIYERSDADVRIKEGLPPAKGPVKGKDPPKVVEIQEGDLKFLVDVVNGHKTGFYLDQGENRKQVPFYAKDGDTLNCFAYTGGFGMYALLGGSRRLTNVETSASAMELLERNLRINGFGTAPVENIIGDAFGVLRRFRQEERKFDLIILDPPKFADSQSRLPRALRGYKDINWLAFRLLRPGGVVFTFSCSGVLDPALFQKIVADAAIDAGREARILKRLGQSPDHAVSLRFPEGAYLKGLVCRAD